MFCRRSMVGSCLMMSWFFISWMWLARLRAELATPCKCNDWFLYPSLMMFLIFSSLGCLFWYSSTALVWTEISDVHGLAGATTPAWEIKPQVLPSLPTSLPTQTLVFLQFLMFLLSDVAISITTDFLSTFSTTTMYSQIAIICFLVYL